MARVVSSPGPGGPVGCTVQLHPQLRPFAEQLIAIGRSAGWPLRATSCARTAQQQYQLYLVGRQPNDGRRTLTQLDGYRTLSKHQRGLAFDLDVIGTDRNRVPVALWKALGRIWKNAGGRWGGDWADFGHFEV